MIYQYNSLSYLQNELQLPKKLVIFSDPATTRLHKFERVKFYIKEESSMTVI